MAIIFACFLASHWVLSHSDLFLCYGIKSFNMDLSLKFPLEWIKFRIKVQEQI